MTRRSTGLDKVLHGLRKSYEQGELDEEAATNKPLEQFAAWFADARRIKGLEPNAMTLATASADGRPSAQVVLLKEFDASGLVWYTNYDSRKGAELDANPVASLLFFWAPLERQVRVEGRVEKVTPEESDAYYAVRPARQPHRRVGLAPVAGDRQPGRAGRQRGQGCGRARAAPAASGPLGWLPPRARGLGVLAGPHLAPARPAALPPRGRRLGAERLAP